jgi:CheY-like chemotaxis protein
MTVVTIDNPPAPRILLAEDDDELRRLLAVMLRSAGFSVIEARDGVQLAELVHSRLLDPSKGEVVDLVVTDVRMPGPSGLAVLADLRRRDWATPVIIITAFGDRLTHAEAERLGATATLDKPFSLHVLRRLVARLVGA